MNVVNFYIIPKLSRYDIVDFVSRKVENRSTDIEKLHSCWRKEAHIIGENYGGWTELYLILGGKSLDVKETNLDVNTGPRKVRLREPFSKMNKNKLKNRLLLSKFVDMVPRDGDWWLGDGLQTIYCSNPPITPIHWGEPNILSVLVSLIGKGV